MDITGTDITGDDLTGTDATSEEPTRLFDVLLIRNTSRAPIIIDIADVKGTKFFPESGPIRIVPGEAITVRTIRLNLGQIETLSKRQIIKTLEMVKEGLA